jgi:hypothetical protein
MYLVISADDHAVFRGSEGRVGGVYLLRRNTETVAVSVEQDALAFALSTFRGLYPLAPAGALVHALEEA